MEATTSALGGKLDQMMSDCLLNSEIIILWPQVLSDTALCVPPWALGPLSCASLVVMRVRSDARGSCSCRHGWA